MLHCRQEGNRGGGGRATRAELAQPLLSLLGRSTVEVSDEARCNRGREPLMAPREEWKGLAAWLQKADSPEYGQRAFWLPPEHAATV